MFYYIVMLLITFSFWNDTPSSSEEPDSSEASLASSFSSSSDDELSSPLCLLHALAFSSFSLSAASCWGFVNLLVPPLCPRFPPVYNYSKEESLGPWRLTTCVVRWYLWQAPLGSQSINTVPHFTDPHLTKICIKIFALKYTHWCSNCMASNVMKWTAYLVPFWWLFCFSVMCCDEKSIWSTSYCLFNTVSVVAVRR